MNMGLRWVFIRKSVYVCFKNKSQSAIACYATYIKCHKYLKYSRSYENNLKNISSQNHDKIFEITLDSAVSNVTKPVAKWKNAVKFVANVIVSSKSYYIRKNPKYSFFRENPFTNFRNTPWAKQSKGQSIKFEVVFQ